MTSPHAVPSARATRLRGHCGPISGHLVLTLFNKCVVHHLHPYYQPKMSKKAEGSLKREDEPKKLENLLQLEEILEM